MHDELQLRIYEIDQQFRFANMTQLQRAELMADRRRIYLQLYPNAVGHGGNRHTRRDRAMTFSRDAAVTLGISVATVNKMLRRADLIDATTKRWLRDFPQIADNSRELDCLATLVLQNQLLAIAMVHNDPAKSVRDVAAQLGLT